MSSPAETLAAICGRRDRPLLVCYLPVGDPQAAAATAARYSDHGVDVLEAGVPVADPYLDGPVVTASMHRALAAGVDRASAAALLRAQLTDAGGPAAVWMSYDADPGPEHLGPVARSGAGGALLLGGDPAATAARVTAHGLHPVPFLDHEPTDGQVACAARAPAYVMLAAAGGVTGERAEVGADNQALVRRLRTRGVSAPVLLGFGISGGAQAGAAVGMGADGVVVGSACVRAALAGPAALNRLLDELRSALDD